MSERAPIISLVKTSEDDKPQMAACGANLLQLPKEILLLIFKYLQPEDIISGVRPTCRYLHDLTKLSDIWKSVTVTHISNEASACFDADRPPASHFACEKFFKKLLRQKCIKSTCGNENKQEKNQQIQRKVDTVTVNSVITSLEERGNVWCSCSVTRGRCYPSLKKLNIVREWIPPMKFLDSYSGLVHLQLEVAHVVQQSHKIFSGASVVEMFQSLKTLTSLQVLKVKCVCSHCESTVLRSDIPSIAKSLVDYFLTGPGLRQLELSTSILQNDEIFKAVLDNCLQLKDLALDSPDLTPKAFAPLSKNTEKYKGLLSLRIKDCPKLNDNCLDAMSVAFPYLTSLELTLTAKMMDESVGHLLSTCCHLTFLKLASPDYETASVDSGEREKITGDCLKELAHSGNLQTLVLENFSLLSDHVFKELCLRQQNLRTLELTKCRVTTRDMKTLADSCPLLQTIKIVKCFDVDSTVVAFLMENLHLQILHCNFSGQHQFDTRHLQSVRKRTRSGRPALLEQRKAGGGLRSLELLPCQNLTELGVSALTLLCPNLNRLHLRAERFLCKNTIREILSSCKQLQHLKLEMSAQITRTIFTGACLNDIQEKGTCLQSLQLLGCCRGFSLTSLAKLLAQSSTLVDCTVPMYPQKKCVVDSATSLVKQLNEVVSGLTHQRKKLCGWWSIRPDIESPLYGWSHLRIRIHSRLPTTKAVK